MLDVLIRGGTVVSPQSSSRFDLGIQDGHRRICHPKLGRSRGDPHHRRAGKIRRARWD